MVYGTALPATALALPDFTTLSDGAWAIDGLGVVGEDGWVGVIVYPGEFVIRKTVEDEAGVVHEIEHDASGEAWEGGPVVLSWEDAQMTGGEDAYAICLDALG